MITAEQRFREAAPNPFPPMQPAFVNAGGFIPQVKRLVASRREYFDSTDDKNDAWETIADDITELYNNHVAELKWRKHSLVRKLQRQADRDAACIVDGDVQQAARSHAELSVEVERTAGDGKAEHDFGNHEWGDLQPRSFAAAGSCPA
jgi:hypothetical protein